MITIGLDYRAPTVSARSGISRQIHALAAAIEGMPDCRCVLFTDCPSDHPVRARAVAPEWETPLARVHRPGRRLRFEHRFLPRATAAEEIDIYIATTNQGLPIPSRRKKMVRVLMVHDMFQITRADSYPSLKQQLFYRSYYGSRFLLESVCADWIVTPSGHAARSVTRMAPWLRNRTAVLPNLVLPPTDAPQPNRAADPVPGVALPQRYWLTVGSVNERRKNLGPFIDAWLELLAQNPKVPDLVIITAAGSVDPERMGKAQGRLHVLSNLSDIQICETYEQAERLWQPSLAEGFGMPVIEAMSLGTPVAVARGTSLDEIVPEGTLRFDPNIASMRVAMQAAAAGAAEDPEALRTWAARYGTGPYRTRLRALITQWAAGRA